jgi:acid stress-induced BolA-like protein IbaG/YrbA
MSEETLQAALETLPLEDRPTVTIIREGRKLLAAVVSASFEGMDEADRQGLVWGHLQSQFEDQDLVPVEFIFTNTPTESEELATTGS